MKFNQIVVLVCIVSKTVHSFYFCDYLVKYWLIFVIFHSIVAEKICNQMTYICYNIQFRYEYYTMEKREIPYSFSAKNQEQNIVTRNKNKYLLGLKQWG